MRIVITVTSNPRSVDVEDQYNDWYDNVHLNDVFKVADQVAVLYLGKMVSVRPTAELDRQIVVDLMTSGVSTRAADPRPSTEA